MRDPRRNILGEAGFPRLQAELRGTDDATPHGEPIAAEPAPTYGPGAQRRLFPGQQTLFGTEMEDPPSHRSRRRR